MKIKKYQAATMNEAMKQVRAELGNDAVILNSKVFYTGGFLGFFKKRNIEVIAAIDPQTGMEQMPIKKEKPKTTAFQNNRNIESLNPSKFTKEEDQTQREVLKEITELKKIIRGLNINNQANLSEVEQKVVQLLEQQEISKGIISDLEAVFAERAEQKSYDECVKITKDFLLSKLKVESTSLFQKKFVNVVGPTGVGKTTTLAKLAAENALKHQKKIAFITTDTYRIAAIDQLKTYAKILNVPIEVAYNVEDFKQAATRFAHYDLVFIDTAGRNFRNKEYVEELQKIISFDADMETYLVLSLTSKQRDMEDIYEQFSLIPISHFIFTKMDETSSYGAMYNMMERYKVQTAFITNGQNVPDDMIKATPGRIIQAILGENSYE